MADSRSELMLLRGVWLLGMIALAMFAWSLFAWEAGERATPGLPLGQPRALAAESSVCGV